MPLPYPFNRYRPTRVPDGDGGFSETLGTATVLFGILEANKTQITMIVELYEDVKINDIVGIIPEDTSTETFYRVIDANRVLDTTKREVNLTRIDRPVSP